MDSRIWDRRWFRLWNVLIKVYPSTHDMEVRCCSKCGRGSAERPLAPLQTRIYARKDKRKRPFEGGCMDDIVSSFYGFTLRGYCIASCVLLRWLASSYTDLPHCTRVKRSRSIFCVFDRDIWISAKIDKRDHLPLTSLVFQEEKLSWPLGTPLFAWLFPVLLRLRLLRLRLLPPRDHIRHLGLVQLPVAVLVMQRERLVNLVLKVIISLSMFRLGNL